MHLCFQLTRNVRFIGNMDNLKFSFLSRGRLESLSLDKFFLPSFKILLCFEGFLVTLSLPLLLECSAETILTIISRARVGYELAVIISYPTSASGVIVLLKMPPKYRKLD